MTLSIATQPRSHSGRAGRSDPARHLAAALSGRGARHRARAAVSPSRSTRSPSTSACWSGRSWCAAGAPVREHFLSFNPQPLEAAARWMAEQRTAWSARLEALDALLQAEDRAAALSPQAERTAPMNTEPLINVRVTRQLQRVAGARVRCLAEP